MKKIIKKEEEENTTKIYSKESNARAITRV